MDFTNSEAITCDYYIYAADGTKLGQAKDIAVDNLVLPIYSVNFSCKGVTGEAVLMDDYRLYATHVNYDFRLYNAATGMRYTEDTKAQTGNVAYRFSWLNAANVEKTYTVMAAYYDGETLVSEEVVKEIKMAPTTDGVDFGVVENKQEGKTLLVYLKDNNPAEGETTTPGAENVPSETTPAPTGEQEPPADNSKLIIIIAAVAAVVIVAVVVVIVASKKKKTTPKTEETPAEKTEE